MDLEFLAGYKADWQMYLLLSASLFKVPIISKSPFGYITKQMLRFSVYLEGDASITPPLVRKWVINW